MRKIKLILLCIILLSNFSIAQEIESGRYVLDYANGEYSMVYYFYNDSLFNFLERTDMVITIGKGNYKLNDSIIILYFDSIPENLNKNVNSCFKILDEFNTLSDTIRYIFLIKDNDGNFIEGVRVALYNNNDPTKNIYSSSKKSGKAKLNFPKDKIGNEINFTYIGYESCKYFIIDSLSRIIEVNLRQNELPVIYLNKGVFRYTIRFEGNNDFFIKNEVNNWLHFIYQNK